MASRTLSPAEARALAVQLTYEGAVHVNGTPEGALRAFLSQAFLDEDEDVMLREVAAALGRSMSPPWSGGIRHGPGGLTLSGDALSAAEGPLSRVPPEPGPDGYPVQNVPAYELESGPFTQMPLGALSAMLADLESGDPARRLRSEHFLRAIVEDGERALALHRSSDPGVPDA